MKLYALGASLCLTLVVVGTSQAQTFNLKLNGFTGGYQQVVKIKLDGHEETGYAGTFDTQLDGGAHFNSYCVDLADVSYLGSSWDVTAYDTASVGLSNADAVGRLFNAFNGQVHSNSMAAALQVAIWGTIYNGAIGTTGPHFQLVDASTDLLADLSVIANTDLSGYGSAATFLYANSHGSSGGVNQNLIGAPVPEPASMAAFSVGLVGLMRRRKLKKA